MRPVAGTLEVRSHGGAPSVRRAEGDDGVRQITGYGSVYDTPRTIEGWFGSWDEEVVAGAWAATIADGHNVRSLFNHDTNRLLATTGAGTLRLTSDDTGLLYESDVNEADPNALSVLAQVERGDVNGASVWFRIIREEWTEPTKANGLERAQRRILEGELFEVGPVVFPAFEDTTATARSARAVEGALAAMGVGDVARRARLAADALADPDGFAAELRTLLEAEPTLAASVCACTRSHDADDPAPSVEHHRRSARALSARFGLPLTPA